MGEAARVAGLDRAMVGRAPDRAAAMLDEAVDHMKADAAPGPLLAVGGGAFLVPDALVGCSAVLRPAHGDVANAVGAAIAQVSGEADQVFQGRSRTEVLAEAEAIARRRATDAGADAATLALVDMEDLPLDYLPGRALRVRTRVVVEVAQD